MVKCPECCGDFSYDRLAQRYICKDCGLTMTREEYNSYSGSRKKVEKDVENDLKKEYLKWWLSKKD